jgi:hypothetical protein
VVRKAALALVLTVILALTFMTGSKATTRTSIVRNGSVSAANNENAYLSISTNTPIHVNEGQNLETNLFVLTNRLSNNPMYVSIVYPTSITQTEFVIYDVAYTAGPYFGEEQCQVSINIEGMKAGVYTLLYEVEAFWGPDYSSAYAIIHVYGIEVTVIVEPVLTS